MSFKKILIACLALVLLFTPIQAHANTTQPTLNDYKEYDSFMKGYFKHSTELAYYYSVAVGSNEYYFKKGANDIEEILTPVFEDTIFDGLPAQARELALDLSKPLAYVAAGADVAKELWGKIKSYFAKDSTETSSSNYRTTFYPPVGYVYKVQGVDKMYGSLVVWYYAGDGSLIYQGGPYGGVNGNTIYEERVSVTVPEQHRPQAMAVRDSLGNDTLTLTQAINYYNLRGKPGIYLYHVGTQSEEPPVKYTYPTGLDEAITNIINNNNVLPPDYVPTVQPQLACTNRDINLTFENGQFKTASGDLITINENETASYNGQLCSLEFKFPEIYYDEGTNKLIVGGKDLLVDTSTGGGGFDGGLIAYIRDSYNYATSVVSTGVNGLRSIVASTTGLMTLFGSFYSVLPSEMTTLIVSAMAISIGLWVFKK